MKLELVSVPVTQGTLTNTNFELGRLVGQFQ